ncbi:MAG: Holliday junction branch migration protein RuvA [Clostridium sp.]|nr:Holliday junction branch migration protein RuvA [Clostridium sp.]MBP3214700.1 Holliday junction branch migration protein RuvA [Clostridium sp.]MBQ5422064.1 Holliday junction branch migration protein RuvA [Clostridium sp.]HAE81690.1 Holliday junction branch migration protein RuvA [Lachnoclostridium sp.]
MISYIRGILAEKNPEGIILEAGGIGYFVRVPATLLEQLPKTGEEVKIFTYMQVKEDDVSLFGFGSGDELEMFRMLIGVNSIGPKGALSILSALGLQDLRLAIHTGDAKRIAKAPGIGIKTAQKAVLDLKDKIRPEDLLMPVGAFEEDMPSQAFTEDAAKEAVAALVALGYSAAEASRAVGAVGITGDMDSEDVLKASLRHLSFL